VTRIETISTGKIDHNRLGYIAAVDARDDRKLLPGDVLFSNINSLNMIGNCAQYTGGPIIYAGMNLLVLRPLSTVDPTWLFWLLKCSGFRKCVESLAKPAINQASISQSSLLAITVGIPPIIEQAGIADFLDRETAKIDTLVNEQSRLIELLKEKRQAVISHAVTKGLDPNAPMKDSGVAWLGQVPEHWEVSAIKRVVTTPVTDGPHETPTFVEEGIPFVSAEAVATGRIDFEKIRAYISAEDHARFSRKYVPRIHDIFLVKSGATTGTVAIVETERTFNIWSPLAAIRVGSRAHPYYVFYFMRSQNFQEAIALYWNYGTQQNIGMGAIQNLAVPQPPIKEQEAIAALLNRETAKLDELMREAECAIAVLQERRTALISAAVTGKIDVRGASPAAAEAA
jgi:type I restriction enzyme S subunit